MAVPPGRNLSCARSTSQRLCIIKKKTNWTSSFWILKVSNGQFGSAGLSPHPCSQPWDKYHQHHQAALGLKFEANPLGWQQVSALSRTLAQTHLATSLRMLFCSSRDAACKGLMGPDILIFSTTSLRRANTPFSHCTPSTCLLPASPLPPVLPQPGWFVAYPAPPHKYYRPM